MAGKRSLSAAEISREIPAARARDLVDFDAGLRARTVFYDAIADLVVVETSRGFRWGIPRSRLGALEGASAREMAQVTLSPAGDGLHWDDIDVQYSVPGLLLDALGTGTLAKELARRGGRSTSAAKAGAARKNGAKGGRPPKKRQFSYAGGSIKPAKAKYLSEPGPRTKKK